MMQCVGQVIQFEEKSVAEMEPRLQNAGQEDAFYPEEHLITWYKENFDSYWNSNLNTMLPLCLEMLTHFCDGHKDNQKAVGMMLAARLRWVVDLRSSLETSSTDTTSHGIGQRVPRFIASMCHDNDYVCNHFDLGLIDTLCTKALEGKPASHQWLASLRCLCSANGVPIERNCARVMGCLDDAADREFGADTSVSPDLVMQAVRDNDEDQLQWHAEFVYLLAETVKGSNPPESMLALVHSLVSLDECIAGVCLPVDLDVGELQPKVCSAPTRLFCG